LRYEQVVLSIQDEKVAESGGYVSYLGSDIAGREKNIRNLDKKLETVDPDCFRVESGLSLFIQAVALLLLFTLQLPQYRTHLPSVTSLPPRQD